MSSQATKRHGGNKCVSLRERTHLKRLHPGRSRVYDVLEKLWRRSKYQQWPDVNEKGGVNRQSTEGFSGSETTPYEIIMMDVCHYTFVQTHRMCNTESEPYGELWTCLNNNGSPHHKFKNSRICYRVCKGSFHE